MTTFFEQLQKTDWLNRDLAAYTYKANKTTLGNAGKKTSTAHSASLLPINDKHLKVEHKVMYAKQACVSVCKRLNPQRKPLQITFTNDFKSYYNGIKIQVTLEPLSPTLNLPSFNHRLDAILGYCIHEMGHVLYTDEQYSNYLRNFSGQEKAIKDTIMNVLEDERIEAALIHAFPGYTGYIGAAKDYCFGLRFEQSLAKSKAEGKTENNLSKLLNSFLHLLRYPKNVQEDAVNQFETELKQIMGILTPYPKTLPDLIECTDKIYTVLEAYYKQEQEQTQDTGTGDLSFNSEEIAEQIAEQLTIILDALEAAGAEPLSLEDTSKMLAPGRNKNNWFDKDLNKVLTDIFNFDNSDTENHESSAKHEFPAVDELGLDELTTIFTPADKLKSTDNHYDSALTLVAPYASSLRAKIQQLNRSGTHTLQGLSEGDFDEDRIVDARMGSQNVYKQEYRTVNPGACIVLCIDESGSMGSDSNWFKAMQIAILFERALEGVNNIDYYCYGHTTSNSLYGYSAASTAINCYYEGRKKSNRKNLGKIYAHESNRDGHALLEVAARVKKQVGTGTPIIIWMISDGEPSASVPSGYTGKSYTKKCVDYLEEKQNTKIIHIAIEDDIPSGEMFNNFVTFTDPQKLVSDVGNMLRKVMLKRQTATEI